MILIKTRCDGEKNWAPAALFDNEGDANVFCEGIDAKLVNVQTKREKVEDHDVYKIVEEIYPIKKKTNNIKIEKETGTLKIDIKGILKKIFSRNKSSKPKSKKGGTSFNMDGININKGLASIGICLLGALSMWITKGETGIGWAIVGLMIIW